MNPKMKQAEKKRIENRMSALRSRMRKKEQSRKAEKSVTEIAEIIEDVLSKDSLGNKYYKKIKDRVDKALAKMKRGAGDSLEDSINQYYAANGEEESGVNEE